MIKKNKKILVVFYIKLEIFLRMRADRTFFWSFFSIMDMSAVGADPCNFNISLINDIILQVGS